LFSNDQVAQFINSNFEAAWEMVREVPIVRIDFGGGNVLTRTLHGNILTSVCTADGNMLDALPGIYNPQGYLDQLDQFRLLVQNFNQVPADDRNTWVRKYHERQAARIAKNQPMERFVEAKKIVPVGKAVAERRTEGLLAGPQPAIPNPPNGRPAPVADPLAFANPEKLAGWKALAEDTQLNETTRRRQIHEMLAKEGLVTPGKVLRPIYKDVLHADLDDPFLGLGKALFENYPFAKEDARP
jgi:hypothetical protein